ncbi:arylamine N-acetyltransferase [Streptomyces lincolnensis]|uniref:Arylamine N-acetyltransferase n=1 Tax=Streptomyces lincolnensis TaxID=1915 RepID=A0A1B1MEL4_STRLN|nr:arylamine N-acetyltransferase [Streptomyces lincolnensis]AXG55937.1 arylamine N-acetyltransferase [Streptomyces lincolnensis]
MEFDLDAYLKRIGWEGERRADLVTLKGVHLAHVRGIPFENLEALSGRAPSLGPADLMAKLVHGWRGGYCYEHNTLFSLALDALGFRVKALLTARVVLGAKTMESRPRTHMALLVEVPGDPRPYLADVGFGATGALLEPVPLVAGAEFRDAGRLHRLVHVPHHGPLEMWVLEAHDSGVGGWVAQYAFTLEPFEKSDFEVINWHVATNPRSPFAQSLYVQHLSGERHLLLHGRLLIETRVDDGRVRERQVADAAEVRRLLEEEFGVVAPPGAVL